MIEVKALEWLYKCVILSYYIYIYYDIKVNFSFKIILVLLLRESTIMSNLHVLATLYNLPSIQVDHEIVCNSFLKDNSDLFLNGICLIDFRCRIK